MNRMLEFEKLVIELICISLHRGFTIKFAFLRDIQERENSINFIKLYNFLLIWMCFEKIQLMQLMFVFSSVICGILQYIFVCLEDILNCNIVHLKSVFMTSSKITLSHYTLLKKYRNHFKYAVILYKGFFIPLHPFAKQILPTPLAKLILGQNLQVSFRLTESVPNALFPYSYFSIFDVICLHYNLHFHPCHNT